MSANLKTHRHGAVSHGAQLPAPGKGEMGGPVYEMGMGEHG